MLWRTSPAATELEAVTLGWLRRLIGLPDSFEGVIYDTASIATLHALVAAREAAVAGVRAEGARRPQPMCRALRVYCSEQAHSSIDKAVIAHRTRPRSRCGKIAVDDEFRMRADRARATRSRRTAPPASLPDRGRRDGRHDVDDQRRSGAGDRGRSASASGSGCTSTRRTPASRRCCRRTRTSSTAPHAPTRSSSTRTSGCSRRSI